MLVYQRVYHDKSWPMPNLLEDDLCPREFESHLPKMTQMQCLHVHSVAIVQTIHVTPRKIVMLLFKGVFCLQIESDIREFV